MALSTQNGHNVSLWCHAGVLKQKTTHNQGASLTGSVTASAVIVSLMAPNIPQMNPARPT
jgi:hypothetical protein